MPAARKPAAKKGKSKPKSLPKAKAKPKAKVAAKPKTASKAKGTAVSKVKAAVKPKVQSGTKARPQARTQAKFPSKPQAKGVLKRSAAAKKPASKPRATHPSVKKAKSGLVPNHLVAARLLRHAAELFMAVGKQNPKAEKTMVLRAKIIETTANRVEADPLGGFEPIEGDEL